ncbi:MAG: hypothetical protein HY900_26065 [Deltaproteobacteria bacterium]|nr:hypothetical protein [Deltaproteobacteria bacterium]
MSGSRRATNLGDDGQNAGLSILAFLSDVSAAHGFDDLSPDAQNGLYSVLAHAEALFRGDSREEKQKAMTEAIMQDGPKEDAKPRPACIARVPEDMMIGWKGRVALLQEVLENVPRGGDGYASIRGEALDGALMDLSNMESSFSQFLEAASPA